MRRAEARRPDEHAVTDLVVAIVNHSNREDTLACLESLEGDLERGAQRPGRRARQRLRRRLRRGDPLRRIPVVEVIAQDVRRGFGANQNAIIQATSSRYVLALNNDTLVAHGALDTLVRYLDEHPWVGAAGPRVIGPDGEPQLSAWTFPTVWNAAVHVVAGSRPAGPAPCRGRLRLRLRADAAPQRAEADRRLRRGLLHVRGGEGSLPPHPRCRFHGGARAERDRRPPRGALERGRVGPARDRVLAQSAALPAQAPLGRGCARDRGADGPAATRAGCRRSESPAHCRRACGRARPSPDWRASSRARRGRRSCHRTVRACASWPTSRTRASAGSRRDPPPAHGGFRRRARGIAAGWTSQHGAAQRIWIASPYVKLQAATTPAAPGSRCSSRRAVGARPSSWSSTAARRSVPSRAACAGPAARSCAAAP